MDSDDEKPDPRQIQKIKELHREMADRRIVIHCKNKKKKKRGEVRRSRSLTRADGNAIPNVFGRSKGLSKSIVSSASSDSEISELGDHKIKATLSSNRTRMTEARVTNTETKLHDFNSRLSQRKNKLEELHQKLKLRKDRLIEREEKLREFERTVTEKENLIKAKTEELRKKDQELNQKLAELDNFESQVIAKSEKLALKTKNQTQIGLLKNELSAVPNTPQGPTGIRAAPRVVSLPVSPQNRVVSSPASSHNNVGVHKNQATSNKLPVLKPIISVDKKEKPEPLNRKISWADSAISSQSPSSNSSDDDIISLPVSQRLKRFENRQLL